METYSVIYSKNNKRSIYKIQAESKKDARNKFIKASNNCYEIIDIKNDTLRGATILIGSLLIVGVILTLVCCVFTTYWDDPEPESYVEYIVEPGETLWSIACLSNMWNKIDTSIIIEDIKDASNCTEVIYPGQIVYIPIYGK